MLYDISKMHQESIRKVGERHALIIAMIVEEFCMFSLVYDDNNILQWSCITGVKS